MNKFFINLGDDISSTLKRSKGIICLVLLFVAIGIIFGFFAINSDVSFNSILNPSDKQMFDFIAGTSSGVSIFFDKLIEFLFIFLIIFVFTLSIYSSFLAFLFIAYQSFLLVITCSVIIGLYNFVGILNVILFVVPINIIFFVILFYTVCVCVLRAHDCKKYNLTFVASFKYLNYFKKMLFCFALAVCICLIHSFVIPFLLRSFILFAY